MSYRDTAILEKQDADAGVRLMRRAEATLGTAIGLRLRAIAGDHDGVDVSELRRESAAALVEMQELVREVQAQDAKQAFGRVG